MRALRPSPAPSSFTLQTTGERGGEGVGKREREKITFVFVFGTSACETSRVSNSPSRDDGGIVVRSKQGHYHVSVSQCLDGVASTLLTGCVETHQQLCPWTR